MTPHIWIATDGDAEEVTALLGGFRDWWGFDSPDDDGMRHTVAVLLGDPSTDYLLAATEEASDPAGVCQLRYRLSIWTGVDDCWLEDLFVRPAAQRGGMGHALVEAAIDRARARGCRRMELDVNERNAGAIDFYRSLDFTTEPKPPGRTLFMARRLDP